MVGNTPTHGAIRVNLRGREPHGLIEPGAVMEVRRGFWLPLEDFDSVEWRYPGQGEELRRLLTQGLEGGL